MEPRVEHWFERYELYYGSVQIGVIAGEGGACGFPPFWCGVIEYNVDLWANESARHVVEYLTLARETGRRLGTGEDATEIHTRMRGNFVDVVDSTDWKLIDSHGQAIPIHCPMHHQNDIVSWVRVDGKEWC